MSNSLKLNQRPFIIGLTGGIGSGKTVTSNWFINQGINVIDADIIAHQVVKKGSKALKSIVQHFGNSVLTTSGELNRQMMRDMVFSNPQALSKLESIIHPAIRQQVNIEMEKVVSKYVILSAPLLLEKSSSGLVNLCNRILIIDIPEDLQLIRASKRDRQNINKIKTIMANQFSRQERLQYADDIILNDGNIEYLHQQLSKLHQHYLELAKNYNSL